MLWKKLKADEFDTDIIEVLRERNTEIRKQLTGLSRDDFSEVYLFFDYDVHQTNLGIPTLQGFPFSKAISGKWKYSRERTSRQGSRTGIRNTKIQFNHSVRCMENRKDFMHLFSLGKGDLWNRQKSRQRIKNSVRISKRKSGEPPTTWQFISAKRAGKP